MIAALTVLFATLLVVEAAGVATFLGIYLRGTWRATAVGRHLALFCTALLALLVLAILSLVWRSTWLAGPILAGHGVFALAIWQRVLLVWRAHRTGDTRPRRGRHGKEQR